MTQRAVRTVMIVVVLPRRQFDVKPDLILSSPARRALTTAEIIARRLDYKLKNIVVDDRMYAVDSLTLLDGIRKLGDKAKRVMLFGHNQS